MLTGLLTGYIVIAVSVAAACLLTGNIVIAMSVSAAGLSAGDRRAGEAAGGHVT